MIVYEHIFIGVIFGFLFPISAIIFELERFDYLYSLENLSKIHFKNKLLYMIDTAPFFLGFFAMFTGISKSRLEATNQVLETLSITDELTGAFNRRYARKKIESLIISSEKDDKKFALIEVDLDRFKIFNDTMGHDFGDHLLCAVSERFKDTLGHGECFARLGGDEFMIIVEEVKDYQCIRDKIVHYVENFKKPIVIESKPYIVHMSIGVSLFPEHGKDSSSLLKHADVAMYVNKKYKKSVYEIFDDKMLDGSSDYFSIESKLLLAMENEEFYLVYQPIIDSSNDSILGVEALLRWENEELGLVPPNDFIPIAERTNTIVEIGSMVLKEACRQGKEWTDKNYPEFEIGVNVSVNQLIQPGFCNAVKDVLNGTGFNPKMLKLEITESVYMENIEEIRPLLKEIKSLGIKVAIDDFGTGYSSLAELKAMDINTLKIDKTFIDDISINPNNDLIVSAIISMGRKLKLNVVAEGVEKENQLEFLKQNKCNIIQGFYYSKPLKADSLEEMIKKL